MKKKRKKHPWQKAQLAKYEVRLRSINDWYEEVSSTVVHPMFGEPIKMKLTAFGMGMPPQEHLRISVVGVPEAHFALGIDRESLEELGQWCIESVYLLDSLHAKKEREAAKIRKQVAEIHEEKASSEWSRKTAK